MYQVSQERAPNESHCWVMHNRAQCPESGSIGTGTGMSAGTDSCEEVAYRVPGMESLSDNTGMSTGTNKQEED